jgi:gamma-glutamyl-gamma-aminobutyrate hydrolase PuuD
MTGMQQRPRIGLTIGKSTTPRALASRANYVAALERARAEVIVLEPGDRVPADIDGLCLSGGPDISPARYGKSDPSHLAKDPDLARDDLEFDAIGAALRRDIPVLGICRGFQLINVALGGSLVLDVAHHEPDDLDSVRLHQDVAIDPSSRLAAASGRAPLDVNSRHHQAVTSKELAPSLHATATVGDLIEAFESDKYRWVVGVQWHPERIGKDQGMSPEVEGVFDAFVQEAARTPTASR